MTTMMMMDVTESTSPTWYALDASKDPLALREREWLLTDGLGGFAMGTALGLNSRRYHGYCVASVTPPTGRVMALNGMVERVTFDPGMTRQRVFETSNFEFQSGSIVPDGFQFLDTFEKGLDFVRWRYRLNTWSLVRELRMNWREGGAMLSYRLTGPPANVSIELSPLVRLADVHDLHRAHDGMQINAQNGGVTVQHHDLSVHLVSDTATFSAAPDWWRDFHYAEETKRGLPDAEDLFTPGSFRAMFSQHDGEQRITNVRVGITETQVQQPIDLHARSAHLERIRAATRATIPALADDSVMLAACDDFVVPRQVDDENLMTIIAGYPWFTDWGRDTMISLNGLLLATGRFEEALATLRTYARYRRRGLIPNVFDDYTPGVEQTAAHYNTVDASLWFVHASCAYLQHSQDRAGFDRYLRDACLDVLLHYRDGTDFGIRMDPSDGLIMCGDPDSQLTWMDARRDGVTFTPRAGKPVEISALWYHGLRAMAGATQAHDDTAWLSETADLVQQNFATAFWNPVRGCLYDCLAPRERGHGFDPDPSIRPNQLFAVCLGHSPLTPEQQRSVVAVCCEHLWTRVGLRTLSPTDPKYRGRFEGDMFNRDSAYHQGTVWPWLMGPFIEAWIAAEDRNPPVLEGARQMIAALRDIMDSGPTLGHLVEVYDGDETSDRPRIHGGTIAQAWSIATLVAAMKAARGAPLE